MNDLHELAELAVKYVNTTDRHIFLTGKAGTGKTTFLRYITAHTFKKAVVAAPTGVAAINAGGVTLHSLFQLPFGTFIPENIHLNDSVTQINTPQTLHRERKFNASKRQLIQELELLIIDEVSMLRADLLDCIDHTLRLIRRNRSEPFGGVQILFIGDLLQLPPVIKHDEKAILNQYYGSSYFFQAQALKTNPPIRVELQKIYRQTEQKFIDLLNRLRNSEQTQKDIQTLNELFQDNIAEKDMDGYIHLTTHNHKANKINQQRLDSLKEKPITFEAYISGDFPENMYPAEYALQLKEGAQVMFIKNDPSGQGKFYNGKIGKISEISEYDIVVQFEDGQETSVEKYEWENKRFEVSKTKDEIIENSLGSFEQYPLKLAWAVTIHKCQGLTFEKAILDLSDTFAPGQLYVALSRLTSMKGLILSSLIADSIPTIDGTLRSFVASFPDQKELIDNLQNDRRQFIYRFTSKVFGFEPIISELRKHENSFNTAGRKSFKQQYLEWTQSLIIDTIPLMEVGNNFINQVSGILSKEEYLSALDERVQKAKAYFHPKLEELHDRIKNHKSKISKEKKTKSYLEELETIISMFGHQMNQLIKLSMFIQEAAQNRVLTKKQLQGAGLPQTLVDNKAAKGKRKDKIPSAKISLEMYLEGKTVEEISKSRNLVKGTIEGHLTKYIETGEVDAFQFVDKKRVKKILGYVEKGITSGSEIRQGLGNDYSYGEIRMVMAHAKWIAANT